MSKCDGCKNGTEHTIKCAFGHFLSYTGFSSLTHEEKLRLEMAYEHGALTQTAEDTLTKGEQS